MRMAPKPGLDRGIVHLPLHFAYSNLHDQLVPTAELCEQRLPASMMTSGGANTTRRRTFDLVLDLRTNLLAHLGGFLPVKPFVVEPIIENLVNLRFDFGLLEAATKRPLGYGSGVKA